MSKSNCMLRGTEMGLHLDEELRKVQSLVSRMLALGTSKSSLKCYRFYDYLPEEILREVSNFFTSTIRETQGLSNKLLFNTHCNLEASQTFFG